jgi:hypothetical protein
MNKRWPPTWLTPVDESAIEQGKGNLAIEFVEAFGIITKDSIAGNQGTPLVLRDWQKELIRHIYASDGNGGFCEHSLTDRHAEEIRQERTGLKPRRI